MNFRPFQRSLRITVDSSQILTDKSLLNVLSTMIDMPLLGSRLRKISLIVSPAGSVVIAYKLSRNRKE